MIQKTYPKTKAYCKVKFSVTPENAETVAIVGLNNDWDNPALMSKKKGGCFTYDVALPKNTIHEFKYLVNEKIWMNDPEADSEKPNEFGGSNSVITV